MYQLIGGKRLKMYSHGQGCCQLLYSAAHRIHKTVHNNYYSLLEKKTSTRMTRFHSNVTCGSSNGNSISYSLCNCILFCVNCPYAVTACCSVGIKLFY